MEEGRGIFIMLTGKPIANRALGRPRRRREDNRMNLKEIGISTRNWVESAQDSDSWRAFVNEATNLQVLLAMKLVNISRGRRD